MKKIKYRTCPICGAHLDPCERCDCETMTKEAEKLELFAILKTLTAAELKETLIYIQLLKERRDRSQPISDEEAAQLLKEAKERIASQQ